jgi:hypothetical protein
MLALAGGCQRRATCMHAHEFVVLVGGPAGGGGLAVLEAILRISSTPSRTLIAGPYCRFATSSAAVATGAAGDGRPARRPARRGAWQSMGRWMGRQAREHALQAGLRARRREKRAGGGFYLRLLGGLKARQRPVSLPLTVTRDTVDGSVG